VAYGAGGSAVTTVPNSGWRFVNWSDGSTANPRTDANVTSNLTVTANFAAVNLSPPALTNGASGGILSFSWPPDHTGWRLLVQTSHPASGPSSNPNDWATVTNSSATNQVSLPINPALPTEYFRLVYP
jgi:hypothetical protein